MMPVEVKAKFLLLYLIIAAIDMHKNALLSFIVFYESIALGFVEKSDGAATDKVSGVNRFLFGNADLNVFKIELFSLSWIGRSGGNIPVLIDISHHIIKAFPFLGVLFSLFFSFFFLFFCFLLLLFSVLFIPGFVPFCHSFYSLIFV